MLKIIFSYFFLFPLLNNSSIEYWLVPPQVSSIEYWLVPPQVRDAAVDAAVARRHTHRPPPSVTGGIDNNNNPNSSTNMDMKQLSLVGFACLCSKQKIF